jgi:hypothetical protein
MAVRVDLLMPSFSDELVKVARRRRFSNYLPAVTLAGSIAGLAAGVATRKKVPRPSRIKHIGGAVLTGTAVGWMPDVLYSGTRSVRR